jgi:histone-lysine N-methyltransferase SETMAR
LDQVLLHQDNAPSHNAASTRLEISLLDFQILEHAPYSPDMAPMDFRVFPTVKSALKGRKFDSFQELSFATQKVVADFDQEWYRAVFDQWIYRHHRCIELGGDYVEKN